MAQQFYQLTRKGARCPVDVATAKSYLRVSTTADDTLIQLFLDGATDYAQKYTGREFRVNRWSLFLDDFPARICLRRDPVDSIVTITRLVSGVATTVSAAVYYLKRSTQFTEVLLNDGQEWPADQDDIEHTIEVNFQTDVHRCVDQVRLGILRHVAFMYENRGDCDPTGIGVDHDAAVQSGATKLYDQIRISRV